MKKETKKTMNLAVMVLSILGIVGVLGYIIYQSLEYMDYLLEYLVMAIVLAVSGLGLIAHPSDKTTAIGVSALAVGIFLIVLFML